MFGTGPGCAIPGSGRHSHIKQEKESVTLFPPTPTRCSSEEGQHRLPSCCKLYGDQGGYVSGYFFLVFVLKITHTLQRGWHDLTTGSPRGNAIVSQGPPGYSAVSGHVVTVFGCTGFLGRYIVAKLGEFSREC